jgi:hypothetical protein
VTGARLMGRVAALERRAAARRATTQDCDYDLSVLTDEELWFLHEVMVRFAPGHRPTWQELAANLDQAGQDKLCGIEAKMAAAKRGEPQAP